MLCVLLLLLLIAGLGTASLDPSGTGTAWPASSSPSKSRLALRVEEDTSMTLESFGEGNTAAASNLLSNRSILSFPHPNRKRFRHSRLLILRKK